MPETTPAAEIISAYDLGDTRSVHESPLPTPAEEVAPSSAGPSRDPSTGQFVKAPTPKHPDRLIRLAKHYEFTDEEINNVTTAELRAALQDVQLEHTLQRDQTRHDRITSEPTDVGTTPAIEGHPSPSVASSTDEFTGVDETQYDPWIIATLKAQAAKIKKLEALEGRINQVYGYVENQHRTTVAQKLDGAFTDLGPSFESMIGKGRGKDMANDSFELALRRLVIAEAEKLAGPKADADQVASKIKEAAQKRFPNLSAKPVVRDEAPAAAPSDPTPSGQRISPEDWAEASLNQPTHRAGAAEPNGKAKAIRTVERYKRERDGQNEPDSKADFPD